MPKDLWLDALADLLVNSLDSDASIWELEESFRHSFPDAEINVANVIVEYLDLPIEVRMLPLFSERAFVLTQAAK